jgi:peptide deformylase
MPVTKMLDSQQRRILNEAFRENQHKAFNKALNDDGVIKESRPLVEDFSKQIPPTAFLESKSNTHELLEIKLWPDKVLNKVLIETAPIEESFQILAEDMAYTMYMLGGVGVAATQFAIPAPLVVCDIYAHVDSNLPLQEQRNMLIALINPMVTLESKITDVCDESCLSLPGVSLPIERPSRIEVGAKTIDGEKIEFSAEGAFARVLQHEIDHLNGMTLLDRLPTNRKRKEAIAQLKDFRRTIGG